MQTQSSAQISELHLCAAHDATAAEPRSGKPLPLLAPGVISIPDWSKRIPALDGLRGIAILLVLLHHSIFLGRSGTPWVSRMLGAGRLTWAGVDLFFVLSGFLIGGILLDAKYSRNYFKAFYIRRAFRIFPLYYLVVGVTLLCFHFSLYQPEPETPSAIPSLAYLCFTQNFWKAGIPALRATWSLCVEEQFYLTIPLLVRSVSRRQLTAILAVIVVAAPVLRSLLQDSGRDSAGYFCYVLMPCRADALALGVLSAILVRNKRAWIVLHTRRLALIALSLVLFLGMIYMSWQGYHPYRPPMSTLGFSWVALFCTALLLFAVSTRSPIAQRFLCNPVLRKCGLIAYGSYLLHIPLLMIGRRVSEGAFSLSVNGTWFLGGVLGLVATLIAASLCWKYFEKPLLRRGHAYQY